MSYKSKCANILLSSPFDKKAEAGPQIRRLLTEEEFFKYCYSLPQFESKTIRRHADELISADNHYPKEKELMDLRNDQKGFRDNFINWLHNEMTDGVYTISGNAGTGKTTFVNYLSSTVNDFRWVILNMSTASSTIVWLNDHMTNFSEFKLAYKKIYSSILEYMKSRIFDVEADTDDEYCNKIMVILEKLLGNYKNNFGNSIRRKNDFFDGLCRIYYKKIKRETTIENIAAYMVEYFAKLFSENDFSQEFPYLLEIFLIFLRCLSDDDKMTVILFDDMERFVCDDELYNEEIDEIRKAIANYARNLEQVNNRNKNLFKFIMVIRNKTARMIGVRLQSADNLPKNLDISEWYDVDDIINKKESWLYSHDIAVDDIDYLKIITGDCKICKTGEITGLQKFIEPLFNNNKRLIIDFLGNLIETPSNRVYIDRYVELMKEDNKICRFAARSLIRGMILESLEEVDSLFEHLIAYGENKTLGIGITRKILTVLYNLTLNGANDISLKDVVANIVNQNNVEYYFGADNSELDEFARSLFYMNSYNRRTNDWIQFVDIQIKNQHEKTTINNWEKLRELIREKHNDIYLNIMPAGEAYLRYIVTSFEFFSLRYIEPYEPLFTLVPNKDEFKHGRAPTEFKCYKKIRDVSNKAFDCIKKINDNLRLRWERGAHGVLHKDRIKQSFYDYIDKFMFMLRYKCVDAEGREYDGLSDLVGEIEKVRDLFKAV